MNVRKLPKDIRNDPVLCYFWQRLYRYDQNVLMIVCGQTGSCKSGSAITIAKMIDRDIHYNSRFTLDRIVFKADEFVKLASSNMPKGSVIMWDEIGVEHDSRNYYTLKNKLIKYVMQTFRYKNFMLIMTVPDLKSIDIGTRRLLHCYMEMQGPVSNRKGATGMVRFVQINPRTGKDYYKAPRFFAGGAKYNMVSYYVPRPPLDFEETYKAKKRKVTEKWYADFNTQLSYMQGVLGDKVEEEKEKHITTKEYVAMLIKKPLEVYDSGRKRFTGTLVRVQLEEEGYNIGVPKSQGIAKMLNIHLEKGEITV